MAKKPEEPIKPPEFSDDDIRRAREWFNRGQDMAGKKNYDYAVQCYLTGLGFWPDAVEEGHKPCYAAALFRGPQKVGFGEKMKIKGDPKTAMLAAEALLTKEVRNPQWMEAVLKNAAKGLFTATTMWIAELLNEAAIKEDKPVPARFELLTDTYEEIGDHNTKDNPKLAITAYDRAVESVSKLKALKPQDMTVSTRLRDIAGKLTILKGKYSSADDFRESVKDTAGQKELHDKDRLVQGDERLDELTASAKAGYEANRQDRNKIMGYVDLLCRRENEDDEKKAIGILIKAFEESNEYNYRVRAEDIRIKQLRRKARLLEAAGDKAAAHIAKQEQLKFELGAYKKRCQHYPTDMRVRYKYGELLFKSRQFDDAIPILQEARNDPKSRHRCSLFIGRCFHEKAYYSQAIDTFKEAIATYETPDDDIGKELYYWMARSYEADGQTPDALKTYGQLIQWDYNFRDVRKRIDEIKAKP